MINGNRKRERKVIEPRQGKEANHGVEQTVSPRLNLNVI
jgi:hypothetical protein